MSNACRRMAISAITSWAARNARVAPTPLAGVGHVVGRRSSLQLNCLTATGSVDRSHGRRRLHGLTSPTLWHNDGRYCGGRLHRELVVIALFMICRM